MHQEISIVEILEHLINVFSLYTSVYVDIHRAKCTCFSSLSF